MIPRALSAVAVGILLALAACRQLGGSGRSARVDFSSLPSLEGFTAVETRSWTNAEEFVQRLELFARASDGRRLYLYHGHVSVCGTLEGHCRPHRFDLAFDETGAYRGLRVWRAHPFTKSAHDPFNADDYQQLDAILRNPVHPLGDLPPPRGNEPKKTEENAGIDGISGATLSYYADHAVPKAFYTTHTVWHAAHRQMPAVVQRWTLEWVHPGDVRAWAAQGDALAVWWLLDHLEDAAIPPPAAVELAYELLAAEDGRILPPALRYLQRVDAPFRPTQAVDARYASIPEEARREFLEWWAAAGHASDTLDSALRADLAGRVGPSAPATAAIFRYLEQTQRVARDPAAWRPAIASFAACTQSTYLKLKAQRLLETP